jgi:nitroreductase
VRKDWLISPEQAEHFLRNRRSIRAYQERSVDRDALAKLVEMASYAPTGHNSQTINWLIISAPGVVQKMAGLVVDWMRRIIQDSPELAREMHLGRIVTAWEKGIDRICRFAPHVIVAHAAKDDRFAPNSCPIALSYLELAAPSFGLGTCWAGYFTAAAGNWRPLQEALGLPEGHKCFGAVMAGYPKYRYHRLPLRHRPIVTWR